MGSNSITEKSVNLLSVHDIILCLFVFLDKSNYDLFLFLSKIEDMSKIKNQYPTKPLLI